MKPFLFIIISLALLSGCGSTAGPEEGPGGEMTYEVDGFTFTWQQDPNNADDLLISISAPTTGWVAVGFQPTTFMQDANLIIGYVDNGFAYAGDDYGTGATTHEPDLDLGGTFDVSNLGGSETSGETTIHFNIPYNSQDQYDKVLVEGETYTFIFAYGADGADDLTSPHVWAKSASFEL